MRILVGITGGIAAYKIPALVRLLRKAGHEVRCVATQHALQFVTPLTLETVSGNSVYADLFDGRNDHATEHIALKDWGDAMVVAPATANCIGKLAAGIGDDALSTLLLAFSHKPLFMAPAMNTQMWECPAVQRNVAYLRSLGVNVIDPDGGELACGASGAGRMAEPEAIMQALAAPRCPDLRGRTVLVTAGPTYERIDAVRFIGNFSSGKMGFALARALAAHGAAVELVAGPTALAAEHPNIRRTDVESAREMFDAATAIFPSCHAAILAAAVADYRPEHAADHKIKKHGSNGITISLVQNPDILATLGERKTCRQTLVGFALETDDEVSNARRKLEKKNLDFIVLNSLRDSGSGFGTDTNRVTILDRDGAEHPLPLLSKHDVAEAIVATCLRTQ